MPLCLSMAAWEISVPALTSDLNYTSPTLCPADPEAATGDGIVYRHLSRRMIKESEAAAPWNRDERIPSAGLDR